jgi:hypothetical protein
MGEGERDMRASATTAEPGSIAIPLQKNCRSRNAIHVPFPIPVTLFQLWSTNFASHKTRHTFPLTSPAPWHFQGANRTQFGGKEGGGRARRSLYVRMGLVHLFRPGCSLLIKGPVVDCSMLVNGSMLVISSGSNDESWSTGFHHQV